MYTTPQKCHIALVAAQDQARGMARTLAATLADMDPYAAYLVLRRHPFGGIALDSLRTASGAVRHTFEDPDQTLPELTDPELRAAWGPTDPRKPSTLLQLLRDCSALGLSFEPLPESALEKADPYEDTSALRCFTVNAEAPEPEGPQEVTVEVELSVTEEVTYEFTAEVTIPAYLADKPSALHCYLAENEELWLDMLDPAGSCTGVNERSLDEARLVLAA
ncbi:hypothetical protein ACVW0K_007321 [Streptomyces filamentosus]